MGACDPRCRGGGREPHEAATTFLLGMIFALGVVVVL
jgi:hypothetical protein